VIATVLTGRRATWIVLAFSVIALVLLAPVTGKLKSVQNNDAINYLPRGAQSTQVQQLLADLPGGNTADAVVVYARTGGLSGPDLARVAAARTAVANGVDLAAPVGPLVGSSDHAAALFRVPLTSAADVLPGKVSRIRDVSVVALVGDVGVVLEDRLESRGGRCRLVAHGGELLQRIFYTSALVSIQHSLSSKAFNHRKRADGWVRGLASLGFNGPDHGCGS